MVWGVLSQSEVMAPFLAILLVLKIGVKRVTVLTVPSAGNYTAWKPNPVEWDCFVAYPFRQRIFERKDTIDLVCERPANTRTISSPEFNLFDHFNQTHMTDKLI